LARAPWAPGAAALAAAARVVDAVAFGGASVDVPLAEAARTPDRAAVRAIALGTLRWYLRLAPALDRLLERPSGVRRPIRALLAAGAHQVEYSRNAPEAAVHAAVDAARMLGAERSCALVNAVLRRFVAERAGLFARIDTDLAVQTAHPAWLAARICAAWPGQGRGVLDANNAHPPMTLRIDLSRTDRAAYLERLAAAGIDAYAVQWLDCAVTLDRPISVTDLPGFADGLVSVQDAGAQLAAILLEPKAGRRVLDACAAPGGKTGHLLERLGEGADVTAVDIDTARTQKIRDNLRRLKRTAEVIEADVRDPRGFWDGRPFDYILCDAPCSATGVIRRHPDIKLLRRATDIPAFATAQGAMLRALVPLLAPGGRLLYTTCSVLPEENEQVTATLLAAQSDLRLAGIPAARLGPAALERSPGVQLLPGTEAGTDGFYYACLEKTTAGS
jgi:16S rRNA (cytosine967-C5)-methyltransferase